MAQRRHSVDNCGTTAPFLQGREGRVQGLLDSQLFPRFAIWDSNTLFKENPHGSLVGPEKREAGKEI